MTKQTIYIKYFDLTNFFIFTSVIDLKTQLTYLNIYYNNKYYIISYCSKIIIFPSFFYLYLISKKKNILNTFLKNFDNTLLFFTKKYQLQIELIGTGYKFYFINKFLFLVIGYSHLIKIKLPNNCEINIDNTGKILILTHYNKYILGNIFYNIQSCKKFNIYKGKGIKNIFDRLKLKLGKIKNIKK